MKQQNLLMMTASDTGDIAAMVADAAAASTDLVPESDSDKVEELQSKVVAASRMLSMMQ